MLKISIDRVLLELRLIKLSMSISIERKFLKLKMLRNLTKQFLLLLKLQYNSWRIARFDKQIQKLKKERL